MIKQIVQFGSKDEEILQVFASLHSPSEGLAKYKELTEVADDFIERSNYLIDN